MEEQAELIRVTGNITRVTFDKERKLKARNRFIREAVRVSGKAVGELVRDVFGGHPYLVQALVSGGGETITLDKASDLIDDYLAKGGSADKLADAMAVQVAGYLNIELTPAPDEEDAGSPNGGSPAAPGPSAD